MDRKPHDPASMRAGWQSRLVVSIWLLFGVWAQGSPKLSTDDPATFFNTLGGILLKSELGLDLQRLQVWPTNQYTPAAHRLLQFTANLYDATTNRADAFGPLPTVFKPVFSREGTGVFITNYVEVVGDATMLLTKPRDLRDVEEVAALQPNDNVYGVPWVLGARKGLPNFNEFAFQSVLQVTRKLQITRPSLNAPISAYQTNQMYILGISNVLAAEFWNSYRSNYTRPVEILVANDMSLALTNSDGLRVTRPHLIVSGCVSLPTGTNLGWPGTGTSSWPNTTSFVIPLWTNLDFPAPSVYRRATRTLEATATTPAGVAIPFETSQGFPLPQWGVAVTNRLQCIVRDRVTKQLLDYVQLSGLDNVRDINGEMMLMVDQDRAPGFNSLWDTNRLGDAQDLFAPQLGVVWQIAIALGQIDPQNTVDWRNYGYQPAGQTKQWAVDNFRGFFKFWPLFYQNMEDNTNLVQEVPFSPSLRLSRYCTWQANDPLVHYTKADMQYYASTNELRRESPAKVAVPVLENIARVNNRYDPWGGKSAADPGLNPYSPAMKDPLVRSSDDWRFPESEPLDLAMLGRVHRGTSWQTVYLKSAPVQDLVWKRWTGNFDWRDAQHTLPTNDWRIVSLLISLLNTNRPQDLASANQATASDWLPILDQINVWINNMTDSQVRVLTLTGRLPHYDPLMMTPDYAETATIADALFAARWNQPGGVFRDPGDVLSVSALSLASPWLRLGSTIQLERGLTDEVYEAIPAQLLSRLRPDSVGALSSSSGAWRVQFTGFDDCSYAVQVSSNLTDWVAIRTNMPANGVFEFTEAVEPAAAPRFYRSVLLP